MVFATTRNSSRRTSNQRLLAAAGGLFCVALIVVAVALHPRETTEEKAETSDGLTKVSNKSQTPWNLALGNVVTVAPDLGLTVKGLKDVKLEPARLAAILDSQLTSLRDIYRAQSEKQPTLLGALLLEIVVGDQGRVTQVRELNSRIVDAEFRKLVLAEVNNWNFKDTLPDGVTIHCPLLFVREGMEMTTLVQWGKNLGSFENRPAPRAPAAAPAQAPAPTALKPQAETAQN